MSNMSSLIANGSIWSNQHQTKHWLLTHRSRWGYNSVIVLLSSFVNSSFVKFAPTIESQCCFSQSEWRHLLAIRKLPSCTWPTWRCAGTETSALQPCWTGIHSVLFSSSGKILCTNKAAGNKIERVHAGQCLHSLASSLHCMSSSMVLCIMIGQ